jgi:hypothetical protein
MPLNQQTLELLYQGSGGSYSLWRDAITDRIYDTRLIGTTVSDYSYFVQQIGTNWRGVALKTINETSMVASGQMPAGQTFLVTRIGVCCIVPNVAYALAQAGGEYARAFNNLMSSSVFELKIEGRDPDFRAHGRHFMPMPIGIWGNQTSSTSNFARVGDMIASGWIKLNPTPCFLDSQVSFQVLQRLGNPDANVLTILNADCALLNGAYGTIMVVLEGLRTRAK